MSTASIAPWGLTPTGQRVDAITLTNSKGVSATVVSYGATVISIKVPSARDATPREVTLCYPDLATLRAKSPYYGSTIGRVANRIAKGRFTVDGVGYKVAANNGPNHLHGGVVGWDKVIWGFTAYTRDGASGARFTHVSHDGDEGYPGRVEATADYRLTEANELVMEFSATTDAPTPLAMCNHTYFNLSGDMAAATIKDHVLSLTTPYYLPCDAQLIPTGKVAPVAGGDLDFVTAPRRVGERLAAVDGGGEPGFDHCFTRVDAGGSPSGKMGMGVIAVLEDPTSGRRMTVSTDLPAVQVYTGNFLSKKAEDAPHTQHAAMCLETENFIAAANNAEHGFPNAVLRPGQAYAATTVHKFEW